MLPYFILLNLVRNHRLQGTTHEAIQSTYSEQ